MILDLEDSSAGVDFTDNDSTELTELASQHTTKSTKGRKLRQVLQKKQLDVLLQTYSSFLDEPGETATTPSNSQTANDFFSIARKNSIEGNPIVPLSTSFVNSDDTTMTDVPKPPRNADVKRARVRRARDLIIEEEEGQLRGSPFTDDSMPMQLSDSEEETTGAVVDPNKGKGSKEPVGNRKHKKKNGTRRKKKVDLKTRLWKANEALKGFSTRAAQKHFEIAADFHAVTKELRHHLKSGANVMFEDLADQFDGMVENMFAGDGVEQRDDVGPQNNSARQLHHEQTVPANGTSQTGQMRQAAPQIVQEDPNFRPLSHEEAIEVMNKQVADMLVPVAALSNRVQENIGCSELGPGPDEYGYFYEAEGRELPTSASF
ncbi:expressed unknown protein [Seminavis robusta]|uniref:Uncharacterized protein n=1 Tax=Seminavis robusta TaxID=568900 RepID=A0A9N8DEZ4_9STRA|nr:expressed unknown protein [Seminavis robusta]|eukprot:Sro125_g060150.1 n/a (375) ;mRNA; f:29280-30404